MMYICFPASTLHVKHSMEMWMTFFCHENQPHPPPLSKAGKLRQGTKTNLFYCLEEIKQANYQCPEVTCVILDGTAIGFILKSADNVKTSINIPRNYLFRLCFHCTNLQHGLTLFGIVTCLKVYKT